MGGFLEPRCGSPLHATAVVVRPTRRAAWLCRACPRRGAGAFGVLLIQPGEELRVRQEFLHAGCEVSVELLVVPGNPEGVLFHGVAFPTRLARLYVLS